LFRIPKPDEVDGAPQASIEAAEAKNGHLSGNGCLPSNKTRPDREPQAAVATAKPQKTKRKQKSAIRIRTALTKVTTANRGGRGNRRPLTDEEADFMVAQARLLRNAYNHWRATGGHSHSELPRLGVALTNWYSYVTTEELIPRTMLTALTVKAAEPVEKAEAN